MNKSLLFRLTAFFAAPCLLHAQPCSLTVVPTSYSVCTGYQSTITAFGANSYTWTGSTLTAPVFAQSVAVGPGNYTVAGDAHTCSASISIGLLPPLNIQITQSSATTCIQSNAPNLSKAVMLTASGAGQYTWSPAASTAHTLLVRPSVTSCYTVVGESSTCSGTAVTCVTVVPQFSIAVSPEVSSICEGESIELSVSQVGSNAIGPASTFTYIWKDTDTTFSSNNSKTVIASPSSSTGFTVTVLDAEQCISTPAAASIAVNACTDLSEQKIDRATFFPNPFSGYLHLHVIDAILIEITDALGKKVMIIKPGEETISSVDTSLLLPGIYFITVTNNALQKSRVKVVKN